MLDVGQPALTGGWKEQNVVIGTVKSAATSNLAPSDGTYALDGIPRRVRRGDPLPPGAAFTPGKGAATPTGPQAPDARQASAALGEGYAQALRAAGYELAKTAASASDGDTSEPTAGEAAKKPAKKIAGPAENTDGAGPSEAS